MRTTGTGGCLNGTLTHHHDDPDHPVTEVINSLGAVTRFELNDAYQVIREINPKSLHGQPRPFSVNATAPLRPCPLLFVPCCIAVGYAVLVREIRWTSESEAHIARHGVTPEEVEEVVNSRPRYEA